MSEPNMNAYNADSIKVLKGLDAVRKIQYRTTRNESTRCNFCKNNCLRTFIDVRTEPAKELVAIKKVTKVPLMLGEQRLIIATCEKGLVEDVNEMKDIKAGIEKLRDQYPNFVDYAAKEVFRPTNAKSVADPLPTRGWAGWSKGTKERRTLMENRGKVRREKFVGGKSRPTHTRKHLPRVDRFIRTAGSFYFA